jgi:hypothetical protein
MAKLVNWVDGWIVVAAFASLSAFSFPGMSV